MSIAFLTSACVGSVMLIKCGIKRIAMKPKHENAYMKILPMTVNSILIGIFLAIMEPINMTPDLGYIKIGPLIHPRPKEFDLHNCGKRVVGLGGFPFSCYTESTIKASGTSTHIFGAEYSKHGFFSIPMNWAVWSGLLFLVLALESLLKWSLWSKNDSDKKIKISDYLKRKMIFLSFMLVTSIIGISIAIFSELSLVIMLIIAGYILIGTVLVIPGEIILMGMETRLKKILTGILAGQKWASDAE